MYFSKLFSNSKIILIEPDLLSFNFSKKNIKSTNFERINFAISNEKKQIGFYSDLNDNRASKINENSNVKINCLTINDVVKKYSDQNFFPFLIKIDIEGHEKELFKSNFEWINDFKIIIIEIHDWMMPNQNNSYTFFKSISDIMNKHKKRDFLISGENLISIRND